MMSETNGQMQSNSVAKAQETLENTEQLLNDLKIHEPDVEKQNGTNEVNENETNDSINGGRGNEKQGDFNGKTAKRDYQSKAERLEKQIEIDSRSIFVGNISAKATAETLEEHFKECGEITRVTILYNKMTGAPKGYAYIEFKSANSVEKALVLKDSQLDGETINVAKKRTNVPGYNNKKYYGRKEWIYPGWHGGVVRQWYYPYPTGYQPYKPNGVQMSPNGFYPQYQYISHPLQGSKIGYPRNNYRNNYKPNYNSRRGTPKGQKHGNQSSTSEEEALEQNHKEDISSNKNGIENGGLVSVSNDKISTQEDIDQSVIEENSK